MRYGEMASIAVTRASRSLVADCMALADALSSVFTTSLADKIFSCNWLNLPKCALMLRTDALMFDIVLSLAAEVRASLAARFGVDTCTVQGKLSSCLGVGDGVRWLQLCDGSMFFR